MDEPVVSSAEVEANGKLATNGGPEGAMPGSDLHKPVAPYLHTLVVLALMIGVSVLSAKTMEARGQASDPRGPFAQYVSTIVWLWLLAALCYIGMRWKKITLRDVIGGRWFNFDDFLIDLAIATPAFTFLLTSFFNDSIHSTICKRATVSHIHRKDGKGE